MHALPALRCLPMSPIAWSKLLSFWEGDSSCPRGPVLHTGVNRPVFPHECHVHAAVKEGQSEEIDICMSKARLETETALNVCIQHVLDRTGLKPHQARTRLAVQTQVK